jgi:mono/diheme cytochrome c family protein
MTTTDSSRGAGSGFDELKPGGDYPTEVVDLHAPIFRENAEPRDGYEPPPMWLWFFCLALVGFGGWYLGVYSGGFRAGVYDPSAGQTAAVREAVREPAKVDPMVLGKRVFNNCASCHQPDGTGVPGNYPPLAGSRWATGRPDLAVGIVLHGLEGEITVEGATYNQVMPAWSHLSDEQIAAVLTYVRASWGNDAPPVQPAMVAAVRDRTADRTGSFTVADLEDYRQRFEVPELDEGATETAQAEEGDTGQSDAGAGG